MCTTSVVDTVCKFASGVNNTGGKLPLVSTTLAVNLPSMSTTLVVHLELLISPQIFENIWSVPNGTRRGLGETDSWKNPEVENLVAFFKLFCAN
jgi:hypothetical protein